MSIPRNLLDQLKKGQVILFLGSGASVGALHPSNDRPPLGNQLADSIAREFLGEEYVGTPLDRVAEVAISETDLITVQEYIAGIFTEFNPGPAHKLIPQLPWRAIFTTNYDLIIERAYDEVKNRLQQLVVFKSDFDRVEERLTSSNHFPYIKLHGCITEIRNKDLPLILTPSQYITHRKNRRRLFTRLEELAYEYPIIFAGYSLVDINIRAVMLELEQLSETKPRSYIVTPKMNDAEKRMWESKRITPIEMTFGGFLEEISSKLIPELSKVVVESPQAKHPIQRKFNSSIERIPSESFWNFINTQVEFIHTGIKSQASDPKAFYKGYFEDWSPIENNLDVSRKIAEKIMLEVFIEDEADKISKQELIVIKGYAGSGKSVLLKRIAWDAAIDLDKLCLVYLGHHRPDTESIIELYSLVKERIYLFIDSAAENSEAINRIMTAAFNAKIPITIITAERHNEWNDRCKQLNPLVDSEYELNYLGKSEILSLLNLLEKHRSLGHLEPLSQEDRVHEFEVRADRQLLVALHEVTYGKPLSDIVIDEYNSITSIRARALYTTVAILHRLGVRTRAGVISRLHNIPFSSFQSELYAPLQYIVFDTKDKITGDIYYHTRHPHISEVLFEQVLSDQDERFYHYSQIISALDIGYESDREAFRGLTRSRELNKVFGSKLKIIDIFSIAENQVGDDPNLLQQRAIFEMSRQGGDLSLADNVLKRAKNIAPWNRSIEHSIAELKLKRVKSSRNELEREKYTRETAAIATKLANHNNGDPHAQHTLLKLGIIGIEDALNSKNQQELKKKINEFEKTMINALREFPSESFILDAEAQYKTLVERHPEALTALEAAFESNKKIAFIALRLAATYVSAGRTTEAIQVLKECIKNNQTNKDLNYRLAKLLMENDGNTAEIKHYLRESFVKGGAGYEAQFWYARILYIEGNFDESTQIFKNTSNSQGDARLKKEPRGIIVKNEKAEVFRGTISSIHAVFSFVIRDGVADKLFMARNHPHTCKWEDLRINQRIKFNIAFNYKGPVAINVTFE